MAGRAMEAIAARYRGLDRQRIEVPEWGSTDDPFVMWAKPYTLFDERIVNDALKRDDPVGFIEVLVNKAEDEDGAPLFDPKGDKPKLMRIGEAHVLKRIAFQIMGGTATVETARGNSQPTATSGGDSASPES